jgi:ribose-phosphate pyrophosphokinase
MNTLLLALPGAEALAERVAAGLRCSANTVEVHAYPDGEAGVRLRSDPAGQRVLLVAHLDHPDAKTLPLLFAADAARDLGAAQVGLVAPYLPYMRQDDRFRPGEAITSASYGRILSAAFDFVVTVDPHLHRWTSLEAVYATRTRVVAAAPAIAEWLAREVQRPIIVGPDAESEQWVAAVAARLEAPYLVMTKVRHGDRDVQVRMPHGARSDDRSPVLLDDIVSSGHTVATASHVLRGAGWGRPLCVAVHALVDAAGLDMLHRSGIARLVSCDTVPHPTNAIGVAPLLAEAIRAMTQPG